jgi:tetratricopeptide (TPR) repeat protein
MANQEQSFLDLDSAFRDRKEVSKSPLEGLFEAGMELFAVGRYGEAAVHFEKALQLNRRHAESRKYLGLAFFHQGKYESAAEQLRQVLDAQPDNEEVLLYCGSAYLAISRYDDAEGCYRKTVAINPKNVKGYLGLGQVLYRKGLYSEAIGIFKKGSEQEKDNPEIFFMLGEAYNKLDKIDQAVSCFETILKHQQDNPKVYYNLGILYDKKALPEKASLMYRRAKELSSPQAASRLRFSVPAAGNQEVFFSRSLTLVEHAASNKKEKPLNRARYEKFRKKQLGKKLPRILDKVEGIERSGTMDLTKASLKINEAIKIIKEKSK